MYQYFISGFVFFLATWHISGGILVSQLQGLKPGPSSESTKILTTGPPENSHASFPFMPEEYYSVVWLSAISCYTFGLFLLFYYYEYCSGPSCTGFCVDICLSFFLVYT